MHTAATHPFKLALLTAGSALLLCCSTERKKVEAADLEGVITQQSDTLVMIDSENGAKKYRFSTPVMERYELAREPYMEFRRGVEIETYKDSTGVISSTLVADYAIFWENLKLWEAKGNVVGVNDKGQVLETQQLFWNQRTRKIYSNVDTRITQQGDVIIGVGFESDEDFNDFTFRRPRGKVTIDTATTQPGDSTAVDDQAAVTAAQPAQGVTRQRRPTLNERRSPMERRRQEMLKDNR